MESQLEQITNNSGFEGIPQGTLCVAEGSYDPIGLQQAICSGLALGNENIAQQFPGQSVNMEDLTIKMRIRIDPPPLIIAGSSKILIKNQEQFITLVPLHNKNGEYLGHGVSLVPNSSYDYKSSNINPVDLQHCDLENINQNDTNTVEDTWNIIMDQIKKKIEKVYQNNKKNITDQFGGFAIDVDYSGTIILPDGKRKQVVMMSTSTPLISRPLTRAEAPSLYPPE